MSSEVLLDVKGRPSREHESAGSGFATGAVSAVDRVSITVKKGLRPLPWANRGCGKSTMADSSRSERPLEGCHRAGWARPAIQGRDVVTIHRDVQMMFQDSYVAMDPRMRIDRDLPSR